MDLRKKLVELLEDDNCPLLYVLGENIGTLADYLIENGVTIQKWIPVTKRLPTKEDATKDGLILAHTDKGRVDTFAWSTVAENPRWYRYWMPMPKKVE